MKIFSVEWKLRWEMTWKTNYDTAIATGYRLASFTLSNEEDNHSISPVPGQYDSDR